LTVEAAVRRGRFLVLDGLTLTFFGTGDPNDIVEVIKGTEVEEEVKLELELELDEAGGARGGLPTSSAGV